MILLNTVISSIAATALFIYLYPKSATWSLDTVQLVGFRPFFLHSVRGLELSFSIYSAATVTILNSNYHGSQLLKSKFDVYVQQSSTANSMVLRQDIISPNPLESTISFLPRLGYVDVDETTIYGNAKGPTSINVNITIDRIDMYTAYRLLQILWESNGSLNVMALGAALVQAEVVNNPSIDPLMIVYMRCPEVIQLHWSLFNIATLAKSPSNNCQFTYNWSPHAYSNETELPILSERYLFSAL